MVEDDQVIEAHIMDFYKNLFYEPEKWRPKWEDNEIQKMSDKEKEWVERPFTMEELEEVIKSFKGDKASGPDGFSL